MAPPNIVDSLYERASSFGRDVFVYIAAGTMFAVVCSVPWWWTIPWATIRESSQFAFLLVAAVVLFGVGHVLLAIGFCSRRLWMRAFSCCPHVTKYEAALKRVEEINQRLRNSQAHVGDDQTNVHLPMEMFTFVRQPGLHATFIERYNALWHLRLALAASFLVAGIVNLVATCGFAVTDCPQNQCFPVVIGCLFGLISILFGALLMRQHLVTNTNFLERIVVAFNISEPTSS